MPKFKVELERPCPQEGEIGYKNPFHPLRITENSTITHSVRSWEFDAADEAEVRKFYDDAVKQDIPQVRGYRIRSITQIAP